MRKIKVVTACVLQPSPNRSYVNNRNLTQLRYLRTCSAFFSILVAADATLGGQTFTVLSGNGQVVQEQFLSAAPLVVQALDAKANPAAGVPVIWAVSQGSGSLIRSTSITDAKGQASATFVASAVPLELSFSQSVVTATLGSETASFFETSVTLRSASGGLAAPPLVELMQPSNSNRFITGRVYSTLNAGMVVRVTAQSGPQAGKPVPNVAVRIGASPDSSSPSAYCQTDGTVLTDRFGIATCNVGFGPRIGTNRLSAIVGEYQLTPTFDIQVTGQLTTDTNSIDVVLPSIYSPRSKSIQLSSSGGPMEFLATAETSGPTGWLTTTASSSTTPATVTAHITASGLRSGSYYGSINIASGNERLRIPVSIKIPDSPTLIADPAVLLFVARDNVSSVPVQSVNIDSARGITAFNVTEKTTTGGDWLHGSPTSATSPSRIAVWVNPSGLGPGTYTGSLTLEPTVDSFPAITISVSMSVSQPAVDAIVNSASYKAGPVAPGEFVTIFGANLGPGRAATMVLGASGMINTLLAGTRVFFNGIQAPIIYTSASQVSAIAPLQLVDNEIVSIQIEYNNVKSNVATLPIVNANPAIFTLNDQEQGAILNQDGTVNTAENPAAQGSFVSIYCTGGGMMHPPYSDGQVIGNAQSLTILAVSATIQSRTFPTLYAGTSPGMPGGILQVNMIVPAEIHGRVPIALTVGTRTGPNVYMWVR